MIVYALIVRTNDGLALSATTDFNDEANKVLKECKKYVKMLANKASQLPPRCTMNLTNFNVFMISHSGVSYIMMCEPSYPVVLGFSFLNELLKQFVVMYDPNKVRLARRPYPFIEFDNFIHKTRKLYNKPQSLTTRINISELSKELHQNPPFLVKYADVEPMMNGYRGLSSPRLGVGPPPKLEPLKWYALAAMVLAILLIALGFYRGFSALQVSTIEDYGGTSPLHGIVFAAEGMVRLFQLYLLLYQSRYRSVESWMCLIVLILLLLPIRDLRSPLQHLCFTLVSLAIHVCTLTRKLQPKLPDYNV